MQHHGTLKRLISLAAVLSVLRVTKIAASIELSVKKMPPSCFLNNIVVFTLGKNPSKSDDEKIDDLLDKIHASIQERAYIYVKDAGVRSSDPASTPAEAQPSSLIHVSSAYSHPLGSSIAQDVSNYIAEKMKIKKPEAHTISATSKADFDSAEGAGLFDQATKNKINNEATQEEYANWGDEAKERLKKTLTQNKFTTIVLETVPAGLLDVLEQEQCFQNGEPKFAIIPTAYWKNRYAEEHEIESDDEVY